MDPEALALLREIRDELRGVRAVLDRQRGASSKGPSPADEAALRHLLPVISAVVGIRTFAVRDLVEHAKLPVPPAVALREALASIEGGSRTIGRLLRRGAGVDIDDFSIEASGGSRDGVLWRVIAVTKTRKTHLAR